MAHEMAHERQRFCRLADGRPRWAHTLLGLEWEAEAEARGYLRQSDRLAASVVLLIISAVRVPLAAAFAHVLWLGPAAAVVVVSIALVATRTWPATLLPPPPPTWVLRVTSPLPSDSVIRLSACLLFSAFIFVFVYKFIAGVRTAMIGAKESTNGPC